MKNFMSIATDMDPMHTNIEHMNRNFTVHISYLCAQDPCFYHF